MDKEKNYLTGCHPHGVFAIGAFGVFGCDALEWDKLFPGINRRVCTLAVWRLTVQLIYSHKFRSLIAKMGCLTFNK